MALDEDFNELSSLAAAWAWQLAGISLLLQMYRPALSGGIDWRRMEWPFSKSKVVIRDHNVQQIPEILQKERLSPNFRLQSPEKCKSIPPNVPYPSPSN